jgi:hypothetical protein
MIWRLLPLDFDDQIDELIANKRFTEASAFIEELDFESEEDKVRFTNYCLPMLLKSKECMRSTCLLWKNVMLMELRSWRI